MERRWNVKALLGVAFVALCLVSHGRAQTTSSRNTLFIAPNVARTVTLSTSGVVVASLNVPRGTVLSVSFDQSQSTGPTADGTRFEFHGDIEVRAESVSQRQSGPLEQSFNQAPVVLTGKGVDVVIAQQ
jgi:hypothetical protein